MILGHVKSRQGQNVLELFQQMQQESVQPDPVAFLGVLNACARIGALEEGRCVHWQIVEHGWDSDVFVGRSLLDMYAKCGSMEDAWRVFNKMISCLFVFCQLLGMQVDEGMCCYASMVTDYMISI
jgi:pentatricopeptide repeat protein